MFSEERRKIRLIVGFVLTFASLIWLFSPLSKNSLSVPFNLSLFLLFLAVVYLILSYLYFPKVRSRKLNTLVNLAEFLLVSFAVFAAGGLKSIFLFFYFPLIIENALFFGPEKGLTAGFSALILGSAASYLAKIFFNSSFELSNLAVSLILFPFFGWLIGEICQKEKVEASKETEIPLFIKEKLSPREVQIIKLLKEDKTNREIATELNRSEKTIKNHLSSIYQKLNVSSRYELLSLLNQKAEKKS